MSKPTGYTAGAIRVRSEMVRNDNQLVDVKDLAAMCELSVARTTDIIRAARERGCVTSEKRGRVKVWRVTSFPAFALWTRQMAEQDRAHGKLK